MEYSFTYLKKRAKLEYIPCLKLIKVVVKQPIKHLSTANSFCYTKDVDLSCFWCIYFFFSSPTQINKSVFFVWKINRDA